MKTYTTISNQNIFDVAMYLYGSVEGVFDLLANNPKLSFQTELKHGMVLNYNEEAVIYPNIVETYRKKKIIPANGIRPVYAKQPSEILCVCILINDGVDYTKLHISGSGSVIVDWGDNSELETIALGGMSTYCHYFDDKTEQRVVKMYGTFTINEWNTKDVNGEIMPVRPVVVNKFVSPLNNEPDNNLFIIKE